MRENRNIKDKQPGHIILFKVLFCVFALAIIAGIIIVCVTPSEQDNLLLVGVCLIPGGFFLALIFMVAGFAPEFEKMRIRKEQYIQRQTEMLQEDIRARDADIGYRALKKRARAIHEGWRLENCPSCGDAISGDEQFCDKCGKALYVKCKHCKTIHSADSKFCRKCGKEL